MPSELVPIPQYTKDDFTETDAPFQFLYQFADKPFLLEQMLERMKSQAAAVGIRSFMKLWKGFLKSVSGQNEVVGNETDFDGIPTKRQLRSGKYVCDVNGVSMTDQFGFTREICPHPIAPVRRYKNIDTREEYLDIWFRKGFGETGYRDETITVAKDTIANSILQLARFGVVVNQQNAKMLAAYLMDIEQLNYDTIEEKQSVTRLGWVGDHVFSPYVNDIYFDGEDDFGALFHSVHTEGDEKTWVDAIRKVRKEKTAARFYLAASFASVILKPCGLLPFLMHTWGGTGNGKTVALMVAASVWACPELGEYVTTYNGTRYAQETTAAMLNSLPLCLDELQIQASQGVKDFDDVIYQLCEGVSKKQGKASGGLRKQQKWRNVILSTGEHTIIKPLSGGGARNRVIEIEVPEKMYSDLVGLCELINHNYGFAGKRFVEWLMVPENMERVKQMQKDFYHELLKIDATEKQVGSASAILVADAIATELIFKDNMALTVNDMKGVLLTKGDMDINQKTLDWLYDYIASQSIHFNPDNAKTEIWGQIDDEKGWAWIIRSVFERELHAHGLDSRSFLSWADRHDLLDHEQGRMDRKKRLVGTTGTARCICIRLPEIPKNQEPVENTDEIGIDGLPF